MINLCVDLEHYPNLSQENLSGSEFDKTYPRTVPLRLTTYMDTHGIEYSMHTVDTAPSNSWYPIAFSWFDFACDYIELLSSAVKDRIQQQQLKLLFYYHEGDNPKDIQQRINALCYEHDLPLTYLFVSANSAANTLDNFVYFSDHEFFFAYLNRLQDPVEPSSTPRTYDFCALNRVHKWWRASAMSDLQANGYLDNSIWSYNTECLVNDDPMNNPIRVESESGWQQRLDNFVSNGPYWADSPDSKQHNDHRFVNTYLYQDSYCHIVIETLFDADGSGGSFLTEKTYKCFKFAQPFVLIGPAGSLQTLRDAGYKTFDNVIDNRYDDIKDNTERWLYARTAIAKIYHQNRQQFLEDCMTDIKHNQQWFLRTQKQQLNELCDKLAVNTDLV